MERVTRDYSVGLMINSERFLVDRVYDHIHVFDWLGYGILKLITDEGVRQVPLTMQEAATLAEQSGIKPIHRDEIAESEHNYYLEVQQSLLERMFEGQLDMNPPNEEL